MKILTNILNTIIFILVAIGIFSIVYFFVKIKPQNEDYKNLQEEYSKLNVEIQNIQNEKLSLDYQIEQRNEIIQSREDRIDELMNENDQIRQEKEEEIKQLQNKSLEEVIDFIINHYGIDKSDISIMLDNNDTLVAIQPLIAKKWSYTIAENKSLNIELSGYKKQVSCYNDIVDGLKENIVDLEQKDSLNNVINEINEEKTNKFKELLEARNKTIRSLIIQRNTAGIVIGVVIIVALL